MVSEVIELPSKDFPTGCLEDAEMSRFFAA
jgi:hypothetical protein